MSRSSVRVRVADSGDLDVLMRFTGQMREVDAVRSRAACRPARAVSLRTRCVRLLDDPAHRVMLAVDEPTGEVLGAAIFTVDSATALFDTASVYVSHLLVLPEHRRRGAGHALVAAAASYADEMGYEHVIVGVTTTGRDANRFFARLGFAPLVIRRIAPVATLRRALGRSEPMVADVLGYRTRRQPRRTGLVLPRALPARRPVRRTG